MCFVVVGNKCDM